MTIAERLRQEGHRTGRQKGLQEGAREEALRIARMMLKSGIERDKVLVITGLSLDDIMANSP